MATEADLQFWVLVWALAAIYLVIRHWRDHGGVGLLLTYAFSLAVIHWLPSVVDMLPWYRNRHMDFVAEGTHQSALAMIGLVVGAELGAVLFKRGRRQRALRELSAAGGVERKFALNPAAIRLLFVVGLLCYAVISRLFGKVTGLQAIVNTGSSLFVVALGLEIWSAYRTNNRGRLVFWLAVPLVLPVVSVITQGFLGYGFAALLTIYAFCAAFFRQRFKVLIAAMVLGYLGLSVYITYMRDRTDIREAVWGGAGFGDRVRQLGDTFSDFEFFDYRNTSHLHRIDERLNQNVFVGAAVSRLSRGMVPYADGSTFTNAVLALVPRALWPNKPLFGGSGDLVSIYTGFVFPAGTSVGVGQVLEVYLNFGQTGILVMFVFFGVVLAFFDRRAAEILEKGDVFNFALWYLPALGFLQVGGSLAEVAGTSGAGLLVGLAVRALGARVSPERLEAPAPALHTPRPEFR